MKANKTNRAIVWLTAIFAALMAMTSCGTSRYAQDMNYVSSMDRQQVVTNEGDSTRNNEVLYLSSVEDDNVIYPELTATEMANAKEVIADNGGKNVDVIIDNTGSRERAASHSNHKDGKHLRDVEDVFEVKNAPAKTNINAGKTSKFFRDKGDSLYFYNAEKHSVHKAEYVGYNVLREKALTGFYVAPDAGFINYNGNWRAMAGARAGYNAKWFDIYGGIDFTSGVKNRDDVNFGKKYDSKVYYFRGMFRWDLSPKGTYYDKFVLEFGVGLMGERRQLAVDYLTGIAESLPENVHMTEDGENTVYHQGYSLIFHACVEANWRVTRNLHVKVGGFAGPGNEYYKGGAEPVKGKFVYGGQLSLSWFIFNKWHKVNPSVASLAVANY